MTKRYDVMVDNHKYDGSDFYVKSFDSEEKALKHIESLNPYLIEGQHFYIRIELDN